MARRRGSGLSNRPTVSPAQRKPGPRELFDQELQFNSLLPGVSVGPRVFMGMDNLFSGEYQPHSTGVTSMSQRGLPSAPPAGANPFTRPGPIPGVPASKGPDDALATTNSALTTLQQTEVKQNILGGLKYTAIPIHLRQELEQLQDQTKDELDQIAQDIGVLNNQEAAIQDSFDTGTQFLQALGLPATVTEAREDPEISSALNAVNTALQSGNGLDDAIDALAALPESEVDSLVQAFGRDQYLGEMQTAIRNQVHNLVQNRQDLEESLIEAEDWVQKEAEAQQTNMWDMFGDPSPLGRGFDVVVGNLEPWFEANFNGIMSDEQWDVTNSVLQSIWNNMPSDDQITEEGEPVDFASTVITTPNGPVLVGQVLQELGMQLGLSPDKVLDLVSQAGAAFESGEMAAQTADGWREADMLVPGESDMATAIYETAEEIYADPETSQMMANSYYLHRLIQIRSGGDAAYRAGGNQVGLGGLPEHTYQDLGYNPEELEGNTEAQMEALLTFIGYKYGAGYEGLQNALSDFVHNPDTWGDL